MASIINIAAGRYLRLCRFIGSPVHYREEWRTSSSYHAAASGVNNWLRWPAPFRSPVSVGERSASTDEEIGGASACRPRGLPRWTACRTIHWTSRRTQSVRRQKNPGHPESRKTLGPRHPITGRIKNCITRAWDCLRRPPYRFRALYP